MTIFYTIVAALRTLIAVILSFFGIANPWGNTNTTTTEEIFTPQGQELVLDGYQLVFEDDFNSNSLDLTKWTPNTVGFHCAGRTADQISVSDSTLKITGEYLPDGSLGAGWYTGEISTVKKYAKGYFEIRCKVNADANNTDGFWSAFWITANGDEYKAETSLGGINACEIDIMEAMKGNSADEKLKNTNISTLWCNGVDDNDEAYDTDSSGYFYVGDMVNEFNTYGVMWTDNAYIFYINGKEAYCTSFGKGICNAEETVKVSLNISEKQPSMSKTEKAVFTVDYVKIYQLEK